MPKEDLVSLVQEMSEDVANIKDRGQSFCIVFERGSFSFKTRVGEEMVPFFINTNTGVLYEKTPEGKQGGEVEDVELLAAAMKSLKVAHKQISEILAKEKEEKEKCLKRDVKTLVKKIVKRADVTINQHIPESGFFYSERQSDSYNLEEGIFLNIKKGVLYEDEKLRKEINDIVKLETALLKLNDIRNTLYSKVNEEVRLDKVRLLTNTSSYSFPSTKLRPHGQSSLRNSETKTGAVSNYLK